LAGDCEVSIRVYDVAGRLVRTAVSGTQSAGPHETVWDARSDGGSRVSRGVYFYRMQADDWVSQKKVVLLDR
jgi:flagellar hook assembly protein FlgD